jgi:PIN domain nuclease of toxin-antitoxin system
MPTLLDTHAWLWWVTGDPRLSRTAKAHIEKSQRADGLWISLISIWEVAKRVEKKQLVLDRDIDQWLDVAMTMPGLQLADIARHTLVESCRLPAPFHGDPADQIIVATAREHSAILVTKDRKIREYSHVRTTW